MIESTQNRTSQRFRAFAAIGLLLLFLLAGCGQSGPLFLPDEPAPTSAAESADEPQDEKKDDETTDT